MKTTHVLALATVAVMAAAASADYTGLLVEESTDAAADALGLAVVDVYATFDNAADEILTATALGVTTTDLNGFWQHPLGSDLAPLDSLIALDSTLAYDSFVTVGAASTSLIPGAFTVDVDSLAFNNVGLLNGTWASLPGNPDAFAGGDSRVLLARLTVNQGEDVSGMISVSWANGGPPSIEIPESFAYSTVPAPGALALLGLAAGLGRGRRRRA